MNNIDDYILYAKTQDKKYDEHEVLCKQCGACCGLLEDDACIHLKKGKEGKYYCETYNERFGEHKTSKGNKIVCVPIRDILHKNWKGKEKCPYVNVQYT